MFKKVLLVVSIGLVAGQPFTGQEHPSPDTTPPNLDLELRLATPGLSITPANPLPPNQRNRISNSIQSLPLNTDFELTLGQPSLSSPSSLSRRITHTNPPRGDFLAHPTSSTLLSPTDNEYHLLGHTFPASDTVRRPEVPNSSAAFSQPSSLAQLLLEITSNSKSVSRRLAESLLEITSDAIIVPSFLATALQQSPTAAILDRSPVAKLFLHLYLVARSQNDNVIQTIIQKICEPEMNEDRMASFPNLLGHFLLFTRYKLLLCQELKRA